MADPLRLFILAGEPSGDRIGADLLQRLRTRLRLTVRGVGGPEMANEGLKSLFPMDDLAVMGFADVLKRLPLILWRLRQVANAILRDPPDVVVLIDSQEFSQRIATRLRRAGLRVPVLLYVGPTVWAWRPGRATHIRPLFDEVLAILPFEPQVMQRLGGPKTSYVGHPALARFAIRPDQPEAGPLLLLPGSRAGELKRHLPLFRAVAEGLEGHPRITGFVLPTLTGVAGQLAAETQGWDVAVDVVTGAERAEAFHRGIAAFAVSGTITFELAMAGVPTVITYVGDRHQARLYKRLRTEQRIGLPNIVAGREIVPELLFEVPDAALAIATLRQLLDDPAAIPAQVAGFRSVRALMELGAPEAPREDPADRVLAHLD